MSRRKPNVTCPTPEEVPALVDRAAVLEAEIKTRKTELDLIKAKLELAALNETGEPLAEAEREGRRAVLPGTAYRSNVTITSDSIIGGVREGTPKFFELLRLLGGETSPSQARETLGIFFAPPTLWENRFDDGLAFRRRAGEQLGNKAPAFIAACRVVNKDGIPRNTISIAFEKAEEVEP